MNIISRRPFGQKYAFVVAAVIFLSLLSAAGVRSAPSVMIVPLEEAFGWSRATISSSAAIGIFLYGLVGPFAAAMMEKFGLRRILMVSLAIMSASAALSSLMSESWHLLATWGLLSGVGSGAVALVLGATVINRWFVTNRGLMMGLLTASTATGSLIFLPAMAWLAESGGWQPVVWVVAIVTASLIPLVFFLVPERPSAIGQLPLGADATYVAPDRNPAKLLDATFGVLGRAMKTKVFWYLFATFFICGFTTNGLVGTHLISFCADMGIAPVQAAGLIALMGVFDLVGTTASGWLTDRFDPRKLLFVYYALRGISLMVLPYTDFSVVSLSVFAVFYGLDWIATVPPTLRLANDAFGDRDAPVVFGWIAAGHQIGAASAAFMGGYLRQDTGSYLWAFVIAGFTGIIAAVISLLIKRNRVVTAAAWPA
jgi:predicted MFS family arabinose efflux permease